MARTKTLISILRGLKPNSVSWGITNFYVDHGVGEVYTDGGRIWVSGYTDLNYLAEYYYEEKLQELITAIQRVSSLAFALTVFTGSLTLPLLLSTLGLIGLFPAILCTIGCIFIWVYILKDY